MKKKTPYQQVRKTWGFNPKSRVKESKKNYDRNKAKVDLKRTMKGNNG